MSRFDRIMYRAGEGLASAFPGFLSVLFYHAGRKEWITDIRWYHYAMYYVLLAFFTGVLLIPFFPETVMQIAR